MKYKVKAAEVHTVFIEVEADDEQDAQSKAEEILACGCYPDNKDLPAAEYSYTLERSDWSVEEA